MKRKSAPKTAKSKEYNHVKIEKKWQKLWNKSNYSKAQDTSEKKSYYCLVEFPYPSGEGLHVGHVRSYTAMDVIARKRRSEGYNVLYPIGWDAFGLPTENFAIKTGKDPRVITKKNTDTFRRQLQALGISFDWSREINTTDPEYYRWTQWIFLQFLKEGLAYKAKVPINWCPKDKIGLANEEVIQGMCERCGTLVEKREKEQWMLAITKYADRLDGDLDTVEYLEKISQQQRNWIGKSVGHQFSFNIKDTQLSIEVFTTRLDTLYGATYIVLAPEHHLLEQLLFENKEEVFRYQKESQNKTEQERTNAKSGVLLKGVHAIHPLTGEEIPVWISDYVLATYGTGAVMAVPAHDVRDGEFAKIFNLPVKKVIQEEGSASDSVYSKEGILINSGEFTGLSSEEAKKSISKNIHAKEVTKYKLRDWVFSRQRYWGEPIPVVHCDTCGTVPVPEKDLPVLLPKVKHYEPSDTGESPLSTISSWVNTTCPQCKGKAKRETDVMPNWAGSSWYFLRYIDPKNKKQFADRKKLESFMPVNWYNGGMEHTTLHLLYSRFWNKFLFDLGLVPNSEPYAKRTSHGLILAEGGEKMSKSKGNVVNPDEIVSSLGADTLRVYEMFMGPFDQAIAWSNHGVVGPRRFLERVWSACEKASNDALVSIKLQTQIQKTIKKVSDDIERMSFNTAISALMILLKDIEEEHNPTEALKVFIKLLSPFAPHITDEIWSNFSLETSVHEAPWPVYDESKITIESVTYAIQINGKVRGTISAPHGANQEEVLRIAQGAEGVKKWLDQQKIERIIFVPNRLLGFITST